MFSQNKYLLIDGGFGTMVQKMNLPPEKTPEIYNITQPEAIASIHAAYRDAGADIITANTFGASRKKLPQDVTPEQIIRAAISIAKSVSPRYIALDIGPLGVLMEPVGSLSFEEAYDLFAEQVRIGSDAGADLIIIETMSDLAECKAAILAAKENSNLPVIATMTFDKSGRTFLGTSAENAAISLCAFGADAIGLNCSLGPNELLPIAETFTKYSTVPVVVQANAGLPREENGVAVYDISPSEYRKAAEKLLDCGVMILGGCCGTTPAYTKELRALIDSRTYKKPIPERVTAFTSPSKITILGEDTLAVIGERINPTGKKKLKEALRTNDLAYILNEAVAQEDAGSDALDVNAGIPDIDETIMLPRLVREIQKTSALPLQLDSGNAEALEKAARVYIGKPIINSVNGKEESLSSILPIAKKYGAVVIGLTLDENGIPKTAEERFAIAEKILSRALSIGIPKENVVIDCLVLTAASDQSQIPQTLRAIRMVRSKLGLKTVLGVSNVSFGLPCRPQLNASYLCTAWGAGLSMAIINPLAEEYQRVLSHIYALNGQDVGAANYIESCNVQTEPMAENKSASHTLFDIVVKGLRQDAREATQKLLETKTPQEIISEYFVPALDVVGDRYDKGTLFLPQLIASAETVQEGFSVLKASQNTCNQNGDSIVIATVKGDVHDIGKNIVRMLLENYGYNVIDLGKDVPSETIVQTVIENKIRLLGLSALMTTTVKAMEETIFLLKESGANCKVMVGGAVLTEEYAEKIGADFYAPDAASAVKIAKSVFGNQ